MKDSVPYMHIHAPPPTHCGVAPGKGGTMGQDRHTERERERGVRMSGVRGVTAVSPQVKEKQWGQDRHRGREREREREGCE